MESLRLSGLRDIRVWSMESDSIGPEGPSTKFASRRWSRGSLGPDGPSSTALGAGEGGPPSGRGRISPEDPGDPGWSRAPSARGLSSRRRERDRVSRSGLGLEGEVQFESRLEFQGRAPREVPERETRLAALLPEQWSKVQSPSSEDSYSALSVRGETGGFSHASTLSVRGRPGRFSHARARSS